MITQSGRWSVARFVSTNSGAPPATNSAVAPGCEPKPSSAALIFADSTACSLISPVGTVAKLRDGVRRR
ncbi:hypothetical protein BANT918_00874 [Brevibacterium antiquum CNRZ 918]|uniref:Uncharacterized protein n=2 Tax=Brevibacterium TaxID=1696 RepID=A0A2H1IDV5_9MICO|nr:hypothetical protein BANT918_00874 [Brevibacterium antiquum CNRZ 918]